MELRHLRYFVTVAEALNFTRAAEQLHLAQPSLTRQIHNLEEELGVRLLHRSKTEVSLTEEGRIFLVDAKQLVAASVESMKTVQRFSLGQMGHLNLGYHLKFNFDLLPATLGAFHDDRPEIIVNLFDMSPAEQLAALENRKIDLGFIGLRPPPNGKSNLIWKCVGTNPAVVLLPAKHPLAKHAKIKMTDLSTSFFVAMSEETHPGFRNWLETLCAAAHFVPKVLQHVVQEAGVISFVSDGLGVALAHGELKMLPHSGVVVRPLASCEKADYWIASHRGNHSKILSRYLEIVKEKASAGN